MQRNHTEIVLATSIIGVILLLIVPLSPLVLDALLSLSLVLSVITLLLTLYVDHPLEFSAFPSLILFLTLFRLGLNIASTRMILAKGYAGDIINTFGDFVMQGSTLVGLIIFLLLTIVNFAVITKGAGRIAEVAARFILEALPGKQMALDGDIGRGGVAPADIQKQRDRIAGEAEFFGAMDGASKFIRGDAVAGILITFVNIVGGVVTGIVVRGLPVRECLEDYIRLTVGDGLISQLPALFISIAAGITVTRVNVGSLGKNLIKQLLSYPIVITLASLLLAVLALLPGMPRGVMFSISLLALLCAWMKRERKEKPLERELPSVTLPPRLEIELGYAQLHHADKLLLLMVEMRREWRKSLGILIPSVHVTDRLDLPAQGYCIKIKGAQIRQVLLEQGEDLLEAIRGDLKQTISQYAHEFINRQEVARLIEEARIADAPLVDELVPKKLPLGQLLKILQNLLKESVPIRDFVSILEILADKLSHEKSSATLDLERLTEEVRQGLARGITQQFIGQPSIVHAILVDPQVEQMLLAVQKSSEGVPLFLRPTTYIKIHTTLKNLKEEAEREGMKPILLTSASSRPLLRKLIEQQLRDLPVLSPLEITADKQIKTIGQLTSDVLI